MAESQQSIVDEVRQIVREFLQYHPALNESKRLPPYLSFVESNTGRTKIAPIAMYIYAMFQAIEAQQEFTLRDGSPFSASGLIFSMLNVYAQDIKCRLSISFHVGDPFHNQPHSIEDWKLHLPLRGDVKLTNAIRQNRYENYRSKIDELANDLMESVEKCTDRLVGIPLSTNVESRPAGHRNMLVVMKMTPEKYFVLIYEPHGHQTRAVESMARADFLSNLQSAISKKTDKYVFVPVETTSCPVGLQAHSGDRVGYCVMFSNFWFYCILHCFHLLIRTRDLSEFQEAILTVESTILEEVSRESLSLLVTNFAIRYCEQFWTFVQLSSKQMEHFNQHMYRFLREKKAVDRHSMITRFPRAEYGNVDLRENDSDLEDDLETARNEEDGMLANDGDECQTSEDCQSQCCDRKVCVSVDLNNMPAYAGEEEFPSLISPLFKRGVDFKPDRDAQTVGKHLLHILRTCIRPDDGEEFDYVWRLLHFFYPRNAIHSVCNGKFDFNPQTLQFYKGQSWISIESSTEMEDMAKQIMHRTYLTCNFSIICVNSSSPKADEMPYHLFFMMRRGTRIALLTFSFNDQPMDALLILAEKLISAMNKVSPPGHQVIWMGHTRVPLGGIDVSYRLTMKHLFFGIAIMFLTHFDKQNVNPVEVAGDLIRVWFDCLTRYQTTLEQIVCRFAMDLLGSEDEDLDGECYEEQLKLLQQGSQ